MAFLGGLFVTKKKRSYRRLNNNNGTNGRYVRFYNENVKKVNKANKGVVKALKKLKISMKPLMSFSPVRIKGPSSSRKKL